MLTFYLMAGGIAVAVTAWIVAPMLRGAGRDGDGTGDGAAESSGESSGDGAAPRIDSDTQVFKDQLAEIERDLDRGVIRPEEAEGARVEVSRRLLAAARRAETGQTGSAAPAGLSGMVAGLALIGGPALAAALYFGIGAPGLPDQPLAERIAARDAARDAAQSAARVADPDRPSQAEAEASMTDAIPAPEEFADQEYADLVAQLQQTVANRPDDAQGHQLLANGLMRLGRWSEAARAYGRVAEILGEQAGADIHAGHAEAMVLATGGYVSPEAEAAIGRALRIDPTLDIARYYAGLALRQAGRLDDAITVWEGLKRESPPDAPYLEYLDILLAETVQARAQANGGAPVPGPTQDQMDAAGQMPEEDRREMIDGMVARLSARLAERGGSPDEWVRLISSYSVLDRAEDARDALKQALAAYPTGPAAELLTDRAVALGLVEAPSAGAPSAPGPTEEDMAAAARMSPEDRAAMIDGMVARLEDRLTTDGGTAEEWLRLLNAYVQLDRPEDAARAYRLAHAALENDLSQSFVKEQALLMGIPVE